MVAKGELRFVLQTPSPTYFVCRYELDLYSFHGISVPETIFKLIARAAKRGQT